MKTITLCLMAVVVAAASAGAQDAAPSKGPIVRLQLSINRYDNDKKVSSAPYTLSMVPVTRNTPSMLGNPATVGRIRTGVQVPIQTQTDKGLTTVYKDVGTSADCRVEPRDDGRYLVQCTLEQASLYVPPAKPLPGQPFSAGANNAPVIRQFRSEAALVIGDGQTGQHSAGIDPASGEQVKVDITLTLMK